MIDKNDARGLPVVCVETRHVRAAMNAQRNKTDAADALGIAHQMRTGWFRQAHIKTETSHRVRLLLTQRRNFKRKFLDLENTIRHSLKALRVRLGSVGPSGFAQAAREALARDPILAGLMEAMMRARDALWAKYLILNKLAVQLAMSDALCRRFIAIPGVGPVTALSFGSAIAKASATPNPALRSRASWRWLCTQCSATAPPMSVIRQPGRRRMTPGSRRKCSG